MDGLLVVDKPAGPTSHDVVARMRRVLRERRIGHTGTLDPMATGVLALVVGRATRLAQFLSGSDKSYDAVVRLGFATDTGDALGVPLASPGRPLPSRDEIDAALETFRGTFMQQPPEFSAKMIDGKRSHQLARARARAAADARLKPSRSVPSSPDLPDLPARPALPAPTSVTVKRLDLVRVEADLVTLDIECSAGFYVRSLAHDLGERLGTGAHLAALRRTRSGDATLGDAISLADAERDPAAAAARVIPLGRMLAGLPSLVLSGDDVQRVIHGRQIESRIANPASGPVRLLNSAGDLVAIGRPASTPGLLHPSIVLV
jgi:tRNA pseudouridine55 synthase